LFFRAFRLIARIPRRAWLRAADPAEYPVSVFSIGFPYRKYRKRGLAPMAERR
jgi:hypothetical protein